MSTQLKENKHCVLWYSKGDSMPYWISDLDGTEIEAFSNKKDAIEAFNNEGLTEAQRVKQEGRY